MKRTEYKKEISFIERSPNLLLTLHILLFAGGTATLIRAVTLYNTSTINVETGVITSAFNTIFPFEPNSMILFSIWLSLSLIFFISLVWLIFLTGEDIDDIILAPPIISSILITIFLIGMSFGFKLKNEAIAQDSFKVAVNHLYSKNKKSDEIYIVDEDNDNVKKINKSIMKLAEKNKTLEQDAIFDLNLDKESVMYPIFQIVEIDGKSHLIASNKEIVEDIDNIKDLGPISVKELSLILDSRSF